jgi:hypothetical protein
MGGDAQTNGFCCEVSVDGTRFEQQTRDAASFLKRHRGDLERLKRVNTVEAVYLDFGHECRLDNSSVCVQSDFLPTELLFLAGALGIGICLSLYPRPEHEQTGTSEQIP